MLSRFITFAKQQIRNNNGTPTLAVPFPSEDIAWPLLDPRRDSGKYVMGLFEAGAEGNGARAHGVSAWTTPKEVVATVGKEAGKEVKFQALPAEVFGSFLPENIRNEILETILLVGNYSYYGKGEEKKQEEHGGKWLVKDADLISVEKWARENGPWEF